MAGAMNLTGKRYGRLTVLGRSRKDSKWRKVYWVCHCSCGRFTEVQTNHLTSGATRSCGCIVVELGRARRTNYIPVRSLRERFEEKFVRDPGGCWLWTASLSGGGYGQIGLGPKGTGRGDAHRVAYELYVGPIPDGVLVMHTCDVRRCVNPAHLRLGSQADNIHDMDSKGRRRSGDHRGEKDGNAKLTDEKVRKLRAEYAAGARQVDLAARYGIWQGTVSSILRRRTWRHV